MPFRCRLPVAPVFLAACFGDTVLMFIDGLALGGYRSFGKSVQRMGPFGKVNLFAGANNSGKSNILRFLTEHYGALLGDQGAAEPKSSSFQALDQHQGPEEAPLVVGFAHAADSDEYTSLRSSVAPVCHDLLDGLLQSELLRFGTPCVWLDWTPADSGRAMTRAPDLGSSLKRAFDPSRHHWERLWGALFPKMQGGHVDHWISAILERVSPVRLIKRVPINLVPAVRKIGDPESQPQDYSGLGIIDRLAKLEAPSATELAERAGFDRIVAFVRDVVGNNEAELKVPYKRDTIHVIMDNKTLPLASLGTGVHEVIILAVAATVLQEQVICIEEPELHLHPLLQRKLILYLLEKTSNQYFITTHSSHFLDMPDVTVFHVRLNGSDTSVCRAHDATTKFEICRDLGCRASDIMQSNCVVWVEGPSDRVYLNHWLRSDDSSLIEGIHYSIMFYGGRLLRHLSANDPEVEEFISLRRLNRNLVVVMDSDRKTPRQHLNSTKKRIKKEFNSNGGFAWVTKGREIENYVERDALCAAVERVSPGSRTKVGKGPFDRAVPSRKTPGGAVRYVDKVKVAHEVVKQAPDLNRLDLQKELDRLVKFIRRCNP